MHRSHRARAQRARLAVLVTSRYTDLADAQGGFTLLEALVAIVIVSIGLLGLLGLQTVAVVNTSNAQARTLASIAVDDIADRMRANPADSAAAVYATSSPADRSAPTASCTNGPCTPDDLARVDRSEWQDRVAQNLPEGKGYIDCAAKDVAGICRVFDVTVSWHPRTAPGQSALTGSCGPSTQGAQTDNLCYSQQVRP